MTKTAKASVVVEAMRISAKGRYEGISSILVCDEHSWPRCAGQGFTRYQCRDCDASDSWPNTNAPIRCELCAAVWNKCLYCDRSI